MLGLGRGLSRIEYGHFGIDMDESRDRFEDVWRIVERALKGGRFTYQGKVLQTPKEVELRPRGDTGKIHFYGAIGASPESANVMADLGMPPMQTSIGNLEKQKETIAAWKARAEANGLDTSGFRYPIMINCIVADSDDEAVRQVFTVPREVLSGIVVHLRPRTESDSTPLAITLYDEAGELIAQRELESR